MPKSHTIELPQKLNVVETYFTRADPPTTQTFTSSRDIWPAIFDNLSWLSNPGNHKSPTPFSYSYSSGRCLTGSLISESPRFRDGFPGSSRFESNGVHFPFGSDPLMRASFIDKTDSVYNKALSRLNERVRGSLDLSVDIAEHKSTARMFNLFDTAESVVRSLVEIKRGRVPSRVSKALGRDGHRFVTSQQTAYRNLLASGSDVASQAYLQAKLGWTPLMGSIGGIADELLEPGFLSQFTRIRARARESNSINSVGVVGHPLSHSSFPNGLRYELSGTREYICDICLTIDVSRTSKLARWSSLNPVSTLYELTPYSFVVDYFYDLGSYIRGIETSLLYDAAFQSGYVSIGRFVRAQGRAFPIQGSGYTTVSGALDGFVKRGAFTRSLLTRYPLPRPPSFSADLRSSQCFTIAALARQLFK